MLRVAPTDATVFVIGETGTGKELVATAVHGLSGRRAAPFVPFNCGAVSRNVIDSELFGHERGSFTGADRQHRGFFERASGGTLFLDEITEMPLDLQVKLLRVLETGTIMRVGGEHTLQVDVRVVAAANCGPEEAVHNGKLREDLFYRLNAFPIYLPPLRHRGEDIELLADHFLRELNSSEGTAKRFTAAAMERLCGYPWPGNVREMKNAVHRAFILAEDDIAPDYLPYDIVGLTPSGLRQSPPGVSVSVGVDGLLLRVPVGTPLAEAQRHLLLITIDQYRGDVRRAATVLGISERLVYDRLKSFRQSGLVPTAHSGDDGHASAPPVR